MFAASAAFEIGPRRERSLVSGARRMNIKTVIEYKGYRIEVSPVGKGWRATIFAPGSTRALADSPSNLEKSRTEDIIAGGKADYQCAAWPAIVVIFRRTLTVSRHGAGCASAPIQNAHKKRYEERTGGGGALRTKPTRDRTLSAPGRQANEALIQDARRSAVGCSGNRLCRSPFTTT